MASDLAPAEIRALRLRLGMTQAQLAAVVGCHWKTVQKWELGERAPRGVRLRALQSLREREAPASPA